MSATWDMGKIVQGEVIDRTDASVDTAAEVAVPVARKTGSAALVVAKATGRGVAGAGRAWVDGYKDHHPQMIRTAKNDLKASKGDAGAEEDARTLLRKRRAEYRQHRKQHLLKTGIVTVVGGGGLAASGLIIGGWVDIAAIVAGLGSAAWHGHRQTDSTSIVDPILDASAPAAQLGASGLGVTVEQLPEGKPFVVAGVNTPQLLAVCVLRALLAEGVPVAEVYDIVRFEWGWQCVVRVSEGTPEAIIAKAGALETRFDLPTGGLRPQPMIERRACAVLRLVEGDPFAAAPGLPYRAPKSISIKDKSRIGTSVGGGPLEANLAGVMGLFVAASGGGKTGLLQGLGEVTTACYDNLTIDLDPHGDGLEDLYDAVRVTGRTTEQIEAVLLFFLMLSKGRARLRKRLGMGKKWDISPERPHITIIFDEFPKASELAKRLAFDLLLVGRKEAVALEIASQGGTKLYLGENIAQMIALKAVGPCKVGDTRAVFGDGAVAEGWLPHRLSPATDTDPKDAGHIYIQGVPGMADEPIEYKAHETPSATLRKLAAERKDAGLVEPDQDSLDAMAGVDLPDYVLPVYDVEGNLKKEAPVELLTWERLLKLCDAEPAAGAVPSLAAAVIADAVDLMDKAGVDRMRTETLVAALAGHDPGAYGDMTPESLKAVLLDAGVGKPVTLGPLDELANPRGFKRDALAAHL